MKLVGLFLALGFFAVMGGILVAMSGDASAQSTFTTKAGLASTSTTPLHVPSANFIGNATRIDPQTLASELPRKDPQKRSRIRCARITSTCWGAA